MRFGETVSEFTIVAVASGQFRTEFYERLSRITPMSRSVCFDELRPERHTLRLPMVGRKSTSHSFRIAQDQHEVTGIHKLPLSKHEICNDLGNAGFVDSGAGTLAVYCKFSGADS